MERLIRAAVLLAMFAMFIFAHAFMIIFGEGG